KLTVKCYISEFIKNLNQPRVYRRPYCTNPDHLAKCVGTPIAPIEPSAPFEFHSYRPALSGGRLKTKICSNGTKKT
ncbi:MAG: hypothetical protein NTV34_04115, partial [Proteobacteria bacterium]|nr:hypothetical protein [Pseudomonadota bacterium]